MADGVRAPVGMSRRRGLPFDRSDQKRTVAYDLAGYFLSALREGLLVEVSSIRAAGPSSAEL